jgi:hypothetical protein
MSTSKKAAEMGFVLCGDAFKKPFADPATIP